MNTPVGMGGVLLVVAAIVWLMVFVPGYAKRGELIATAKNIQEQAKKEREIEQSSPQQRLDRLVRTQRIFSVLFVLLFITAVTSGLLAGGNLGLWILSITSGAISLLSLGVTRLAAKEASKIAHTIHSNRQSARSSAAKAVAKAQNASGWTPNQLPDPLSKSQSDSSPEVADVIDISKPRRMMTSKEIDEILARRRAI
jgi:uncharacterized membrane protein